MNDIEFTFIDLFAGIGGFRQAFEAVGGKCVFSSEWDKYARATYQKWYGEKPAGDIQEVDIKNDIPDHTVLCAGFPCQPFSLAGVSKKQSLGLAHGFDDPTQGTMFYEIKKVLELKKPKAFMLENVKNLVSHDKNRTFKIMQDHLEGLGYVINWKIVDGAKWLPQHRERIYIVGFDSNQVQITKDQIEIPTEPPPNYEYPKLKAIIKEARIDAFTLGPGTWDTLQRHKKYHSEKGNGFGYGIHTFPISDDAVTRTISARYHKDGAEILIDQGEGERPRRLTVEEAQQLQGFDPNKYKFPVSMTQAYKQIGNSVVIPAVQSTANEICKVLRKA